MEVKTTMKLLNKKTGVGKEKKDWYLAQFLDNEEKHINFFVSKDIYSNLKENNTYNISVRLYYDLKAKKYNAFFKVVI